jgi:hypothetical protein
MAYFARHGVFFALILEEFLGNILHDGVEEREREMWFVLSKAEY